MSARKAGGAENGPSPYTAPSDDFVPAGYFSPPSMPPSPEVPRPYQPVAQPVSAPPLQASPVQPPQVQDPTALSWHVPRLTQADRMRRPTGLVASTRRFFTEYATFSGRSSRSEFWWVQLFILLVSVAVVVLVAVTSELGSLAALGVLVGVGYFVFLVGVLMPSLALTVRRLHDANLSAGFLALALIPSVGGLIVFILLLLPSSTQGTRFDRPPSFGRLIHQQQGN